MRFQDGFCSPHDCTASEALDSHFMRIALALAIRNQGQTWPNPSVGALIVQKNTGGFDSSFRVIGCGQTGWGGRPHAETEALAHARATLLRLSGTSNESNQREGTVSLRDTWLYVTLEPCAHYGQTPPCTDALIAAGISRVIIGVEDPDPRVAGQGIAALRAAGIEVCLGVEAQAAERIQAGHFARQRWGRPSITLKMAVSSDGMIGRLGEGQVPISSMRSRALVQLLRATHDAVLVGGRTAHLDNPQLTCRCFGLAPRSPLRIVLDPALALSPDTLLVRTARQIPLLILTNPSPKEAQQRRLQEAGCEVISVSRSIPPPSCFSEIGIEALPSERQDGQLDLHAVFRLLAERGLTSVLVEGGGRLARALLAEDLVDRFCLVRSQKRIGKKGVLFLPGLPHPLLSPERYILREHSFLEKDQVIWFERKKRDL